jgi:hypothetical protein
MILSEHKRLLLPNKKEQGKYHCPACSGHNLSFSKQGHWNCFNDPTRQHRIEIIKALFPNSSRNEEQTCQPIEIIKAIDIYTYLPKIPLDIKIQYPTIASLPQSIKDGNCTSYYYSETKKIDRYDLIDGKKFKVRHRINDRWIDNAGESEWEVYGLNCMLSSKKHLNLILVVEGQKSVQIGFNRKIPTICLEAGDFSERTIPRKLDRITSKFDGKVLLAILPDNDTTGEKKAAKLLAACIKKDILAIVFSPNTLGYLNPGDDIEQINWKRRKVKSTILKLLTKQEKS